MQSPDEDSSTIMVTYAAGSSHHSQFLLALHIGLIVLNHSATLTWWQLSLE